MADQSFPLMPVTAGGPQAPLETPTTSASPHPQSEGGIGTAFSTAYRSSPVVTAMMRGYGDLTLGDQTVPQDKAVDIVKAQGLDPAFIPKDGIGYGALQEEIQRQGEIKLNQLHSQRSGGTSFGASVAGGLAAGIADPSSLVLGPAAGAIADIARGGLAVRAAVGAAEGATYQFGMEAGEAHLTGHDDDILSWQTLHDTTIAGLMGGGGGAVFGPRAKMNAGDVNLAANNPGNLRVPRKTEFQTFKSLDEGVNAVGRQLELYRKRGINTIDKIVNTYAPASDHNNTAAYIADVAKKSGLAKDAVLTDADVAKVRDAMIDHEQGPGWRNRAATLPQKPVVAYHGTNADFTEYDATQGGKFGAKDAQGATFFTSEPDVAAGYADFASLGADRGEGVNVRPVQMNLENPKVINWGGEMYSMTKFKEAIVDARKSGNDGVIFKNVQDDVSGAKKPSDIYAVFDANKSTKPHFGPREQMAMGQEVIQKFANDNATNLQPTSFSAAKPADMAAKQVIPKPIQDHMQASAQREAAAPLAKGSPAEHMAESTKNIRDTLPEDRHEAFDETIKAAENEPEGGTKMLPAEFDKAVQAAVRCGVLKGASYAGD